MRIEMEDPDYTGTKTVASDGRIYLTEDLAGEEVRVAAERLDPDDPRVRVRQAAKQLGLAIDDLDDEPDEIMMALGFTDEWLAQNDIERVQDRAAELVEEKEEIEDGQ